MIVLVTCSPETAVQRTTGPEAIEVMQIASDSLEAAYLRGDADRIADLMTESVRVSPIGMSDLEGRESVRTLFSSILESMSVDTYHFNVAEAEIHGITAYDRGTFVWESVLEGESPERTTGRYHAVRHRGDDGIWRIHRLIENESPE